MLSKNEWRLNKKRHLLAAVPLGLALFILLYPGLSARSIDASVLTLIVMAVLIAILPWEHVTSFKAAGVELTLDNPQVRNAVEVLKLQRKISDEKLQAVLKRFEHEIEYVQGSRILWIDDTPRNILGERRLLRALGMEIVMAVSSTQARDHLTLDGDFDVIISDVRRGSRGLPEGVRFIEDYLEKDLRQRSRADYSHIPSITIIFYSGATMGELLRFTQGLQRSGANVLVARGVEQLLHEGLRALYQVRREAIAIVQDPEQTSALTDSPNPSHPDR